jgi:D-arginine dehydrogenase
VGQGGFGIQTSPAAAKLCAALLLEEEPGVPVKQGAFSPRRFRLSGE